MDIRPLGKRVLVRRAEKKRSAGGILLPDTAQEKPKEGEVLAVGPGKTNDRGELETLFLKVGDRVLFSSYAGTEVKEEEGLMILSEDDVLGIITEE